MRNIKLTLEYDGRYFFGFQKQKRRRTIQGELETALKKLFRKNLRVIASGRTDSGVHAEAQVVNFSVNSQIPLSKIQLGLNRYLPEDLAVIDIEEVSSSFHSQHSAKRKTYEYRVLNSKVRSPLKRFESYHYPYPLNLGKMRRAAESLCGRHDFRAFEASRGRRKNTVRTIQQFRIQKKGNVIHFTVQANGFLYKMVRSMVGTLLDIGSGQLGLSDFKQIFTLKDRSLVGPTVPPQGLMLKEVSH